MEQIKVPKPHRLSQEKHQLYVELHVNHLIMHRELLLDSFDSYVHQQSINVGRDHQDIPLDDSKYHNRHLKHQPQHMNRSHAQMDLISIV